MLVDFDISKTSWTKFSHIVNKPFSHISDFVLASYTFGYVKMSVCVPNNRYLREVLIFFFHSKKTVTEAPKSLRWCCSKWNNVPSLVPSLQRRWFRCWWPHAWRKAKDADIIYYELLKPNIIITGERYRTQLMRLSRALREKRPQYEQRHESVILLHDNARPHVAKPVKTYLETIKWEVLPHPPYSPDK